MEYHFLVENTKITKIRRLKMQHFHTKLPCEKPMLRLIEWGVQNEPIAKSGFYILAATGLPF